jgi:hypothetical protein
MPAKKKPAKQQTTRRPRRPKQQEDPDAYTVAYVHPFEDGGLEVVVFRGEETKQVVLHKEDSTWGFPFDAADARELACQIMRAADEIDPGGSGLPQEPLTAARGSR